MKDNIIKQHPSYGMIGFHRVRGGNPRMFGSSVPHEERIVLEVKHAEVERHLSREWYHGLKTIAEVEMSYSQFAEAISNMNVGDGVPCTILATEKDGRMPECDFELDKEQYSKDFRDTHSDAYNSLIHVRDQLQELFDKPRLTKKDKEEIMMSLEQSLTNISRNADYVARQFDEYIDKTVMDAKGEIEAFVQHKVHSLGLQKLYEDGLLHLDEADMSQIDMKDSNET